MFIESGSIPDTQPRIVVLMVEQVTEDHRAPSSNLGDPNNNKELMENPTFKDIFGDTNIFNTILITYLVFIAVIVATSFILS